ncbi:MAG: lipid II flippase MurJ, partial [Sneathiella sp.]
GQSDRETGTLLSWGVAAAGVAQVIFLVIACTRQDIKIKVGRPRLNKDVKRLLKLMLPGALGAGVMQINILVGTIIASFLA